MVNPSIKLWRHSPQNTQAPAKKVGAFFFTQDFLSGTLSFKHIEFSNLKK
jgi:hypothetical protein